MHFLEVVDFGAHLLWPTRCAGCDGFVGLGVAFCEDCEPSLHHVDPACQRCAMPLPDIASRATLDANGDEGEVPSCPACVGRALPFSQAQAAFVYGGAVADGIVRFKHANRPDLAAPLGAFLAPLLEPWLHAVDAVIPVPLHPRRLRKRGYNQSQLIARRALRLASAGRRAVPPLALDMLSRARDTPDMGHGSPAERAARVQDAFVVRDPARVTGRRFLVVDDVMTTGATLAACARALCAAGAARVVVVALARAV